MLEQLRAGKLTNAFQNRYIFSFSIKISLPFSYITPTNTHTHTHTHTLASTNIDEQLPISSVNGPLYDDIVLMAEQEPKEIEVTPNAAYAAVLTLR